MTARARRRIVLWALGLPAIALAGGCAARNDEPAQASGPDPLQLQRDLARTRERLDVQLDENRRLTESRQAMAEQLEYLRRREKILAKQLRDAKFRTKMLQRQIDALKSLKAENQQLREDLARLRGQAEPDQPAPQADPND